MNQQAETFEYYYDDFLCFKQLGIYRSTLKLAFDTVINDELANKTLRGLNDLRELLNFKGSRRNSLQCFSFKT